MAIAHAMPHDTAKQKRCKCESAPMQCTPDAARNCWCSSTASIDKNQNVARPADQCDSFATTAQKCGMCIVQRLHQQMLPSAVTHTLHLPCLCQNLRLIKALKGVHVCVLMPLRRGHRANVHCVLMLQHARTGQKCLTQSQAHQMLAITCQNARDRQCYAHAARVARAATAAGTLNSH